MSYLSNAPDTVAFGYVQTNASGAIHEVWAPTAYMLASTMLALVLAERLWWSTEPLSENSRVEVERFLAGTGPVPDRVTTKTKVYILHVRETRR